MQKNPKTDRGFQFAEHLPQANEVSVFLSDFDIFPGAFVSAEEHARGESMQAIERRRGFLAGRRLLRTILSHMMFLEPSRLGIHISKDGAPFLEGDSAPHFNVSHSGGVLMVAISPERIGVDLEFERSLDQESLADRFFSAEEVGLLRKEKKKSLFFKLWTSREAAIKADGRGLGKLLSSTKVTLSEEGVTVSVGDALWSVNHRIIDQQCHVAVASRHRPSLIRWCDLR